MPEDHLPEARRVLKGAFYGTYYSMTISLVHCVMNIVVAVLILYSRVSTGPSLLSGRCKCFCKCFHISLVFSNCLYVVLYSVGGHGWREHAMCVVLPLEELFTN